MKLSPSEQEAIVALLTRIYSDICPIESDLEILVGEGDFRPRIEYFHDAVRAFTSGNPMEREIGGRLSVEWLAYDLEALRYIQAKPLGLLTKHDAALSPSKELIKIKPGSLAVHSRKADRATRERLVELYQHYGLLYAALLKVFADRDCQERTDALNNDVRDIHALLNQFDHGKLDAAMATIRHLEDPELRRQLTEFIQGEKRKKRESLQALLADLKKVAKTKDQEIAAVEKAHLQYGLAQLALYESGKDILKKMMKGGMNLAGKFVESAMAAAQREMGR